MLESSQWMIVGQPRDLARSSPVDNAQMYIVGKCPAEGRGIPTAIGIRSPLSEGLLLGFDPAGIPFNSPMDQLGKQIYR